MEFPVLIAACNEEDAVKQTLDKLPRNVTPYVIANGCIDRTAEVADEYGAYVIELEEPGKLPALQEGIKALGESATEPFITLDADSRPLMPKRWPDALMKARTEECDPDAPAVVTGPSVYHGDNDLVIAARWTLRHYVRQRQTAHDDNAGGFYGRNLLFDLHDQETVDEVLSLPHYWPREDVAMKDVVVAHEGETYKSGSPMAAVVTSARRFNSLHTRLELGAEKSREVSQTSYEHDHIPGSRPYISREDHLQTFEGEDFS